MNSGPALSLSIIVPVHRVQGYLRQCLDSILVPDLPSLEVIAVNDCSPDHSGEILDEYAARDPRLQVIHLTENQGLGGARNVGLDRATGDYVWFFDSDDYATSDGVRSVYDRLCETRPDVLVFDYAREYWDGRVKRSVINHLFREPPAPDVFTAADRQSVLRLMMTAWNRAIRRDFLLGLGLRFSHGYYEDVNVTYPVLMAAEKISLLDQVCYIYRQRRQGAITRTASTKHFDAFAQYDRIFAFMDSMGPEADRFRPMMFDRTIWHLLVILERGDRVPPAERARFFAEMSKTFNKYRPAGHDRPTEGSIASATKNPGPLLETLAVKYEFIRKNDLKGYDRFMARKALRKKAGKAKKKVRKGINFAKRKGMRAYYHTQLRRPVEANTAVFASYWYRGYACNPAAMYEKARELAPHVRSVWIVKPSKAAGMPKGVPFVVSGTREYYRTMARSKYFVNNVNFPNHVIKRKGQVHVMTQHGTPLKRMGLDQQYFPAGAKGMDFTELMERSERWDFHVSANPLTTEAWERSFPVNAEMLEIGYPRNDRLVRATDKERARLRERLAIPEGKKAVLYTPTHREYRNKFEPMFDIQRFARELGDEYVLLLRAHYFYRPAPGTLDPERVIDVSAYPTVEDLYIASDAMLTDYSSAMFDYAVLPDRPIVVFANDWETYKITRGVNFDITEFPPGLVAYTEDELLQSFASGAPWESQYTKFRDAFRERFCPWEDGQASERAVRRIFLDDKDAGRPPKK
ncbi:bifunctional glycosyltransferase/CDP-glycerol:glycerophosphate glycerophosphotransferase [Actinomadura kijaniata]|uniref:bifunctional glycosyltransferase/CDP-glycerol:glycerophosphate glycerophosphotransferase n=1 Tax=Actinomadura kijaniata TaxID=46161 RepID=UPI00083195C6|nr:bifunctional glycosyltransferase family 2 protein/CDP-glycerol:glycerophosphate glycerophosphotransferase [Actinomadura kijaniata]